MAAGFDPRFATVFPTDTNEATHLFDLLRRGYVDARYNKRYPISERELEAIAGRVEVLKGLTGKFVRRGLQHSGKRWRKVGDATFRLVIWREVSARTIRDRPRFFETNNPSGLRVGRPTG